MKDLVNCKCYWLDEEWHSDMKISKQDWLLEYVTMPSTFMQCENCKTIKADELFMNNLAKGE